MDELPEESRPSKRPRLDESTDDEKVTRSPAHALNADDNRKEIEVGITAWVEESRPVLYGILKKRYTDFLVNEISSDGSVAHLRDLGARSPNEPAKDQATPVVNGTEQ